MPEKHHQSAKFSIELRFRAPLPPVLRQRFALSTSGPAFSANLPKAISY
jgi:hypothetical protein